MIGRGDSIKFKHISTNRMKILNELLGNQRLLKYIFYLDEQPLSNEDVNPSVVRDKNFVFTKFDESIITETEIKIFFTTENIIFPRGNTTAPTFYMMDIILHNKYWTMYRSMIERPYAIADEIAKSIDQKSIAGVGRVWIGEAPSYKVNQSHAGVSLRIEVENATVRGH